jgi:hypothetical protein
MDEDLAARLKSIDFWLGAIASNLQVLVRLEAKKQGIEVLWHDPSVEPWPQNPEHGKPAIITKLYAGIPREMRAKKEF